MSARDLPPGWASARIGDLIILNPKNDCDDATPVGFVPLMLAGTRLLDEVDFETRAWADVQRGYAHFADGDVLLARITPSFQNGKAGIVRGLPNGLGAGSTEFFVCRPLPDVLDPTYLLCVFKTNAFLRGGEQRMTGAVGQQRVPKEYLLEYEIPLPPLAEQRRIVKRVIELGTRLDRAVDRLKRTAVAITSIWRGALGAAMSGGLTADWRDEHGRDSRWRDVVLGDIADVGTGGTPSRSNAAFYATEGVPWVTSASTRHRMIDQPNAYVTDEAVKAHRLRLYPPGTLIVAMYGDGKTRGQVSELGISATVNQACAAITVDAARADHRFVKLALEASYDEMRAAAGGASQANLNLEKVRAVSLPLPELDEQREIVERVARIRAGLDRALARHTAALTYATALTEAIPAAALRGSLVEQSSTDEPASRMLARTNVARSQLQRAARRRPRRRPASMSSERKRGALQPEAVAPDHLASILRSKGPLPPHALWSWSQLEIDDFYAQLKLEEEHGLLSEHVGDGREQARTLHPAS
jgi:type I restriction enzyme, S subunit